MKNFKRCLHIKIIKGNIFWHLAHMWWCLEGKSLIFSYILFIETKIEDSLRKKTVEILQANIGLYCNQACNHCFVESSPKRKEMMLQQTAERCLLILQNSPSIHTLDLTGRAKAGTASHTNTCGNNQLTATPVLHVVALTALILKMYKNPNGNQMLTVWSCMKYMG